MVQLHFTYITILSNLLPTKVRVQEEIVSYLVYVIYNNAGIVL